MQYTPIVQLTGAARLVGLVALVAFLTAQGLVPIPRFLLPSTTDGVFPCSSHECGCASAQQCWDSCCCFSTAEKVRWARARDLAVPRWAAELAALDDTEESTSDCPLCLSDEEPAEEDESPLVMLTVLSCTQMTQHYLAGAIVVLRLHEGRSSIDELGFAGLLRMSPVTIPSSDPPSIQPPPPRWA